MQVGFVNFYAYRPHGHQSAFLAKMCGELGYKTYSLDCFGSPKSCYVREYKGTRRTECFKCSAGGLHTFNFDIRESIKGYWSQSIVGRADDIVRSSAFTLTRIESYDQRGSPEVCSVIDKLSADANRFYYAARSWITANSLQAVILFNGRMDYTRAVLEACKDEGVTCITHERPLYGHGIILNKDENCSSLKNIHRINRKYIDKPLNVKQVAIASCLAAQRLIGGNLLEWKLYNENPQSVKTWPITNVERKVLVCPSSKNELLGHPDWETPWHDNTDALDSAVRSGLFKYSELLVRFHPSWASSFGVITAEKCEEHYLSWCERHDVPFISSEDDTSTKDLIRLTDLIVLNGSNTILEAGVLGKPVLCFGPSPYTYSGAAIDILSLEEIDALEYTEVISRDPREIVSKTLRYFYNKAVREPYFTDFVRSKSVTECEFYGGADSKVLDLLIKETSEFESDDEFDISDANEQSVITHFLNNDLPKLKAFAEYPWETDAKETLAISRRGAFKIVDSFRKMTPKGV